MQKITFLNTFYCIASLCLFLPRQSHAEWYVFGKAGYESLANKDYHYLFPSCAFGFDFQNFHGGDQWNEKYGIEFTTFAPKWDAVYYYFEPDADGDVAVGITTYADYNILKLFYEGSYSFEMIFDETLYLSPTYLVGMLYSIYNYSYGEPGNGFNEEGIRGKALFAYGLSIDKKVTENQMISLSSKISMTLTPIGDRAANWYDPNGEFFQRFFTTSIAYGIHF